MVKIENNKRKSKKCIIKNNSETIEQKYDVMLKKIFLIIKETQDLIIKNFEKGKFANMHEIEETRDQQDKFILFCRRLLIKEKSEMAKALEAEWETWAKRVKVFPYYRHEKK